MNDPQTGKRISRLHGTQKSVECMLCSILNNPDARKAVRWNTPLYGKADGWIFSIYCFKKYVQLTFFRGVDLVPVPPGSSKVEGVRYFNVHENDVLDEILIAAWISQAAELPGVKL